MTWVGVLFACLLMHLTFDSTLARTDQVRLLSCDSNNRRIVAARISSGDVRGKLECYYEPKNGNYLFRIQINTLNLAKQGSECPQVRFSGFTSKRKLPDDDLDWQIPGREIIVPADPQTLALFDCNNYKNASGKIFETQTVGQKIEFVYDTKNIDRTTLGNVQFTITSYISGPSYRCPDKHFRCWSTRHVCIDESVECDDIDNCYDNSDEDSYKCTGKVLGIYLPMFVIMVLLIFLLVIGAIIAIILACRRRNRKIAKATKARNEAAKRGNQLPYYLPYHPGPYQYTQPPPEVGSERKKWQQLQMEQQSSKANSAYDNSADC